MTPSHAPAGVVWIGEVLALHGLEPGRRHLSQRPISSPEVSAFQIVSGRMRKDLVDHDVLRVGFQRGVIHGSISFKRVLRLANRSRQKAP